MNLNINVDDITPAQMVTLGQYLDNIADKADDSDGVLLLIESSDVFDGEICVWPVDDSLPPMHINQLGEMQYSEFIVSDDGDILADIDPELFDSEESA